jgi:hypothetical protein
MKKWRAADAHNGLKRIKMEQFRACKPVVANLRHSDKAKEQDPVPEPHQNERSDPDPHQSEKSDPDPHQS